MTEEQLPPEPGTIEDPHHGIPDDEVVFGDDGQEFSPEVNEDEEDED